jgi:SAM-dependent methyltransferase
MGGPLEPRLLLTRFLSGSGVEIGPGHMPFPLPFGGASTLYVDRWQPDDNRELFPELGDAAEGFIRPDIVADLDTEGLSALADASQDFVIASHVLEHLADPLGQLAGIHRVLRPGGVALILLPDRRQTFDRDRPPTPLDHLVEEHRAGVTAVDDAHLEEFLRATGPWDDGWSEEERREVFDLHRRRSIHAHTWTQHEFPAVLDHAVRAMGMRWELLDCAFVEDAPQSIEFGMVLRRSTGGLDPEALAERLRATWSALHERARAVREAAATHEQLVVRFGELSAVAEGHRLAAAGAEAQLSRLRSLPGYAPARRLYRALRRLRPAAR